MVTTDKVTLTEKVGIDMVNTDMGTDKEKALDELYHTIDTLDELMMRDWMRKHIYGVAHWEKVRDLRQGLFLAKCSRCKRKYKINIKKWWNFCPYCGSYMKGE